MGSVFHVSGKKNSADHDAAMRYSNIFSRLLQKHDLKPCQLYKADETSLYWHCVPTRTLASGEEKSAFGFNMNKERLTLLLCANASGDHRCKLFDNRRRCTEWLQQD